MCRKKKDKRELIRIVRTSDGKVMIDLSQKAEGRGAYICSNPECIDKIDKKNYLIYALRGRINKEELKELKSGLVNLLKRGDVKCESL